MVRESVPALIDPQKQFRAETDWEQAAGKIDYLADAKQAQMMQCRGKIVADAQRGGGKWCEHLQQCVVGCDSAVLSGDGQGPRRAWRGSDGNGALMRRRLKASITR